jgi:hypothetical protein
VTSWAGRAAPQQGAQPGEQLLALEGLDEVVVGAGVQPLDARLDRVARRQDQDRDVVSLAQAARDLHAVHLREAEIQDDEVGHEVRRRLQRNLSVGGDTDLVALQAQRALQDHRDLVVVLHHEDPGGAIGSGHGVRL